MRRRTVTYKLRDWLFCRQRYWGEPFPIVYDEDGLPARAARVDAAGASCPRSTTTRRARSTPTTTTSDPEPPLARATEAGSRSTLDLGDGPQRVPARDQHDAAMGRLVLVRPALPRPHQRERASSTPTSSATGWARSPTGDSGGVDLYVGGVEHAVLHLLYARFWHKVLYDLGHVSSREPFHRLFNQGYIQAPAYTDERGIYVEAGEVVERDGGFFHDGEPVTREFGKMGKSLKNVVTPDDIVARATAPTRCGSTRCPWARWTRAGRGSTQAVVGVYRFLQRRLAQRRRRGHRRRRGSPTSRPTTTPAASLHRTIAAVRDDMEATCASTPRSRG